MGEPDPDEVPAEPIAIVIGGTGEVGEGLVRALASNGYRVVVPTRDPLRADALLDRLGALGGRVRPVVADVTTDHGVARVRENLQAPPRVVVVCLGGAPPSGPLVAVAPSAFDRDLAANLRVHYLVARGFAAMVAGAHGVYVVVTGGSALQAARGAGPLSVASAGQLALADVLATELPGLHVVSLVLAGAVRSRSRNRSAALDVDEVGAVLVRAVEDERTRGLVLVVDRGVPGEAAVSVRERARLEPFTFTR